MSAPQTVVSALKKKYCDDDDQGESFCQIYVPKSKGASQSADVPHVPPRLTLEDYNIQEAGDDDDLRKICKRVKELDLTKNSIRDWTQIFRIIKCLPQLRFLNLAFNPLYDDTVPVTIEMENIKLTNLVLNGTHVGWSAIGKILTFLPCLSELHLSLNKFTTFDLPGGFSHDVLTKLFLNDCNIEDWLQVASICRHFPKLTSLTMIKLPIKHLPDATLSEFKEFGALTTLNISETALESWEDVDQLRRFPALNSLRISGIPFLEEIEQKMRRQLLIARLPNIVTLNGSKVSGNDRENAERFFIRHYMEKDDKPVRYDELENQHGRMQKLLELDLGSEKLGYEKTENTREKRFERTTKKYDFNYERPPEGHGKKPRRTMVSAYCEKFEAMNYGKNGEEQEGPIKLKGESLSLEDAEITAVGDGAMAQDLFGCVKKFFLSMNYITDWAEIFKLLQYMPQLYMLELNKNQLTTISSLPPKGSCMQLTTLKMMQCCVPWDILAQALTHLPCVNELWIHASFYETVDLPADFRHDGLKWLKMGINPISDWAEVLKVGTAFPNLDHLELSTTKIAKLSDAPVYTEFPNLTSLMIPEVPISEWSEFEKFSRFPSLTSLMISGIPLFDSIKPPIMRKKLAIAYLPKLQLYSASPISEKTRQGAHDAFLKYYEDRDDKPARYFELKAECAKLEEEKAQQEAKKAADKAREWSEVQPTEQRAEQGVVDGNKTQSVVGGIEAVNKTQSVVRAIEEKYLVQDDDTDKLSFVHFTSKSNLKVMKEGKVTLPPRLTLERMSICEAGDEDKVTMYCHSVQELDLTRNSFTDWMEVFKILRCVPNLVFLNLANNHLDDQTLPDLDVQFTKLKTLVLNATHVTWTAVAKLLKYFPSLTELYMSMNSFESVDLPAEFNHAHLSSLFLNNCKISDWSDMSRLGHAFPNLGALNTIEADLSTLSREEQYSEFQCLKSLNVSGTKINSWEELVKFRRFPALVHLRIKGIPLAEDWHEKTRRQHMVAFLPNITHLNGSPISDTEREDAERALIRYYMDKAEKPNRYTELEEQYGKLDPLVHVDLTPPDSLRLLVKFEDKSEFVDINIHQTVWELKKLLTNFTGLPPSKFYLDHLQMRDDGAVWATQHMKLPAKQLLRFNMELGDELEVIRKQFF